MDFIIIGFANERSIVIANNFTSDVSDIILYHRIYKNNNFINTSFDKLQNFVIALDWLLKFLSWSIICLKCPWLVLA